VITCTVTSNVTGAGIYSYSLVSSKQSTIPKQPTIIFSERGAPAAPDTLHPFLVKHPWPCSEQRGKPNQRAHKQTKNAAAASSCHSGITFAKCPPWPGDQGIAAVAYANSARAGGSKTEDQGQRARPGASAADKRGGDAALDFSQEAGEKGGSETVDYWPNARKGREEKGKEERAGTGGRVHLQSI
jgi:hypothetical protein